MPIVKQKTLVIKTSERGIHRIDSEIRSGCSELLSAAPHGILHLFIKHTSASLLIQENTDPTAKADIEHFFLRLAPDDQPWHTHLAEGSDDTTSHFKAAILPTSLTIPFANGDLLLGQWQGLYIAEHRHGHHQRQVVCTVLG